MFISQIEKKNKAGYYDVAFEKIPSPLPSSYIFDDEKSVKWNREEVVRINKENKEKRDNYLQKKNEKRAEFRQDMIEAGKRYSGLQSDSVEKILDLTLSEIDGEEYRLFDAFEDNLNFVAGIVKVERGE